MSVLLATEVRRAAETVRVYCNVADRGDSRPLTLDDTELRAACRTLSEFVGGLAWTDLERLVESRGTRS